MARDLFHEAVKTALLKEGWTITHDPYRIDAFSTSFQIDLGAERLIAAERDKELIAVEVKSFIGSSAAYDFHLALGQYLNYTLGIQRADPKRILFLAVPTSAYEGFFQEPDTQTSIKQYGINLLSYDDREERIIKWVPQTSISS